MRAARLVFLSALLLSFTAQIFAQPIVIAHRGASGYLPEHTLEAVVMAYMQGADYIEQDVVLSKDNIPVVLHDIHIDTITNVATQFPDRKRDDGRYYAIDFTLAELKTLRVFERRDEKGEQVFPDRYKGDAHFTIATLQEELEIIQQLNRQHKKQVGYYVEIKAPKWHKQQGKDISTITLTLLRNHGLDTPESAIYIQCFDFAETKRLRHELKAQLKLVQLIAENDWQEAETNYDYLKTEEGIKEIATVAQGIGPWIPQLLKRDSNKKLVSTGYAEIAHNVGLKIHPYTYRIDALVLDSEQTELLDALFKTVKVDGVFSDFTDVVRAYLNNNMDKQAMQ
ncbi:glycerophosphodiester phosphodiesterase [Paraneptunicella aestuarii]|uniref:glycerophosphodiester phosphodiesterase n=1 Tax=Paraneptunicella aestuarii TaxID=2831148 RepID=UPI001E3DD608|nr:glycerophosphodiester phosphodiesterase [Paraneptunicella aestuarii]